MRAHIRAVSAAAFGAHRLISAAVCRIAKGHADAILPLLSHALFFYSRHLAQYLADKGYNAAAKNDVRMVEVRALPAVQSHCSRSLTAPCGPHRGSLRCYARTLRTSLPSRYATSCTVVPYRRWLTADLSPVCLGSQVSQFFGKGFAQVKVSFVCDVIRLCKNKHQMLWKKHRDARIKVSAKGYCPNARLQPTKPPVQPATTPAKPVPKRRCVGTASTMGPARKYTTAHRLTVALLPAQNWH